MRTAFTVVLALHGLIHFMGFAKAFRLADLPQLAHPVSRGVGVAWLVAGLLMLASAAMVTLAPRWWWAIGALALVASQAVIASSWSDAKFGTLANGLLLLGVAYGFASRGPLSLRAEFARDLTFAAPAPASLLTEEDLAPLPEPVKRYVRRSGVVGQPRVRDFRATWTGRMRRDPQSEWMPFTAEQLDTLDEPRRFFLMDATMKGLPVDVLHAFDARGATMRVKALSLVTMVDAKGAEVTRAETVTLFNDLCFLAPGALVSPSITWEAVDAHTARARYTLRANTIGAELRFNDDGELIDFASADRAASSPDGKTFNRTPWTTPARDYARVGPARVATKAEVKWHPAAGAWVYGEFELTSLAYNTGR
jgi:uncharacterized protein DUF6544